MKRAAGLVGDQLPEGGSASDGHDSRSDAGHQGAPAGHDPRKYFPFVEGQKEFQANKLARDIEAMGPLAVGTDGLFWTYYGGAWRLSDSDAARDRATRLLGDSYRRNYATNAGDIIRARAPRITCEAVPQFINFRNGLYDWQADELCPHDRDAMSTAQLAVKWHPTATCPAFDKFLSEVLPEDMIELAWELIGYLMYSGNPLHKAVMLVGKGRNGKGTFLRVMNALLGKENVTAVSLQALAGNRFAPASLFGKLANIAGDIDGGYLETTATFKAITGEDVITAEHKGRDAFDFRPWAVPVFSANKIPASADVTPGFMARWLVVPFPNSFNGVEDRGLTDRLTTPDELAGVAAKAMSALRRLMARGDFALPRSATEAKSKFVRAVDQVQSWLDERATVDSSLPHISRKLLYEDYRSWALDSGHRPVKASEFYDRLEDAGAEKAKVKGFRGFKGIMIGQEDDDDDARGQLGGRGADGALLLRARAGGSREDVPQVPPPAPQDDDDADGLRCAYCHRPVSEGDEQCPHCFRSLEEAA